MNGWARARPAADYSRAKKSSSYLHFVTSREWINLLDQIIVGTLTDGARSAGIAHLVYRHQTAWSSVLRIYIYIAGPIPTPRRRIYDRRIARISRPPAVIVARSTGKYDKYYNGASRTDVNARRRRQFDSGDQSACAPAAAALRVLDNAGHLPS